MLGSPLYSLAIPSLTISIPTEVSFIFVLPLNALAPACQALCSSGTRLYILLSSSSKTKKCELTLLEVNSLIEPKLSVAV